MSGNMIIKIQYHYFKLIEFRIIEQDVEINQEKEINIKEKAIWIRKRKC